MAETIFANVAFSPSEMIEITQVMVFEAGTNCVGRRAPVCAKFLQNSNRLCDMAHNRAARIFKLSLRFISTFNNFAEPAAMAGNVPSHSGKGKDMAATVHPAPPKISGRSIWQRGILQTLGAIKTGVVLLILVVILSAAGTVILQRPTTDVDEMQRAYSPQVLRLLDAVSLTDVFHAWWFVLLLSLVSLSIIAASVQRFPNAWRYFSRPYKSPDEAFRKALPTQALIPINHDR